MQLGLNIPPALEAAHAATLAQADFSGCFELRHPQQPSALSALLELAREFACAPISGFKVGALVVGKSGKLYLGANLEFTGVPLHASLHAEQSAVINAWMHGESGISALIVSELPCGHCRQFLLELHDAAKLPITVNKLCRPLAALIPEPFARTRPKGRGLLDSPLQNLVCAQADPSDNAQRAINAASRSYTPYNQSPEGFLVEVISGHRFAGRAAESIAFNPSVPPVVTALNQLNLSAQRKFAISRCTHAKLATALTHSLTFSDALLRGICNVPIESVQMESGC